MTVPKTTPDNKTMRCASEAPDRPKRLLISLANTCQYRCVFCVYLHDRQRADLPLKDWMSVLKQARAAGFGTLEIGSQGEPTLHPHFERIAAAGHRLGYKIEILTNLQKFKSIRNILPHLRILTINMNATTPGEFQAVHGANKRYFRPAIKHIADILNAIDRAGFPVEVKVNYVITKDSIRKALGFVKRFHEMIAKRLGRTPRLRINFHHMLLTPGNHRLAPDKKDLQHMLNECRVAAKISLLQQHTNIRQFMEKTQRIIDAHTLMDPLNRDTLPTEKKYPIIKRLNGLMTCDACRDNLFIDCNGDIFGCFNPTRILFGLPAKEDPTFYGNVKDGLLTKVLSAPPRGAISMDFTDKFWKACVICGLKTQKQTCIHSTT
ncbi:MAG: radical SAM protein [Candidatus Omnitrophica bacterium]|nr:radical SAM protein [Candidatus Omnitrophota bacterium]MDD5574816.1 radical SAM protein [Candidatus Omnitrophota bacterium]